MSDLEYGAIAGTLVVGTIGSLVPYWTKTLDREVRGVVLIRGNAFAAGGVCVYVSVSVSMCLCLCVCVCVYVSVPVSVCVLLSLSLPLSLAHTLSPCAFASVCIH